jgi:hypothetical protein
MLNTPDEVEIPAAAAAVRHKRTAPRKMLKISKNPRADGLKALLRFVRMRLQWLRTRLSIRYLKDMRFLRRSTTLIED